MPPVAVERSAAATGGLAYNLGNLWQRLGPPRRIKIWSVTSLQHRLMKTGGRLVKHARYYWIMLTAAISTASSSARCLRGLRHRLCREGELYSLGGTEVRSWPSGRVGELSAESRLAALDSPDQTGSGDSTGADRRAERETGTKKAATQPWLAYSSGCGQWAKTGIPVQSV